MSIRSSSVLTVEPAWRNEKLTLPVRVADGSVYEPIVAEPEIELIEEVGVTGLLSFPVPSCAYHLRVVDSIGTEWFISFNARLVEDTEGERSFLEVQLSRWHVDGMPSDPDEVERVLAPSGIEVLEEWVLEDGRAK
jgi:hypothetical protein